MTTSRRSADERRRALLARPPQGSDGVDLLETDLERLRLGDADATDAVIAEATAAAIGAVRRRGWVELPAKHFPAEGVPIPPGTWLSAYAICRQAGDRDALAALSHPPVLGLFGHEQRAALLESIALPSPSPSPTTVRYRYPPARTHRDEERDWFLDLEGFPREGRDYAADGRTCTARGGPGLPLAVLSVEADRSDLPDLLDVGELVLAADLLADRAVAEADPHAARAWLAEAADCLATARARPAHAAFGERGQQADPARCTPDALSTLESAWRRVVDGWNPTGPPLAVLRLRLEPLLRAIAVDGTGVALRDVRPRDSDYAKAFTLECRARARDHYERLWSGPIDFRHPAPGSVVETALTVTAGSETLMPGRVWATWRYVVPSKTAVLSYDGLVWCDDHWAWFPKPHRV